VLSESGLSAAWDCFGVALGLLFKLSAKLPNKLQHTVELLKKFHMLNKFLFLSFLFFLSQADSAWFGGGIVFAQFNAAQNKHNISVVKLSERSFVIPFQVRQDNTADPAKEVELLVSKDHGGHWYSVGRKPVEEKSFLFETESDGEYWFSFRTISLSGSIKHSTSNTPQICVHVETAPTNADNQPASKHEDPSSPAKQINQNNQNKNNNTPKKSNQFADNLNYEKRQVEQKAKIVEGSLLPPKPIHLPKKDNKIAKPQNIQTTEKIQSETITKNSSKQNSTESFFEYKKKIIARIITDINELIKLDINTGNANAEDFVKKDILRNNNADEVGGGQKNDAVAVDSSGVDSGMVDSGMVDFGMVDSGGVGNKLDLNTAPAAPAASAAAPNLPISRNFDTQNPTSASVTITAVTLNKTAEQSQIIVKWDAGDTAQTGIFADVLRGDSITGPWRPIVIGSPNKGEYWWYFCPDDKKPFYLMVRTRNSITPICEATTKSPIIVRE
jgi:hypothetical protein